MTDRQDNSFLLDVEQEMHDVAILDHIILPLDPHLPGGSHGRLRLQGGEILIFDNLCADKALLKIRVDDTGRLWSLVTFVDGPCPAFIRTSREKGLKSQQMVGALNETYNSGLLKAHFFEKHLSLLVDVQFRNFRLCLG